MKTNRLEVILLVVVAILMVAVAVLGTKVYSLQNEYGKLRALADMQNTISYQLAYASNDESDEMGQTGIELVWENLYRSSQVLSGHGATLKFSLSAFGLTPGDCPYTYEDFESFVLSRKSDGKLWSIYDGSYEIPYDYLFFLSTNEPIDLVMTKQGAPVFDVKISAQPGYTITIVLDDSNESYYYYYNSEYHIGIYVENMEGGSITK